MTQKVMVVDDDEDVRSSLMLLLRAWFPHVELQGFSDGARALAVLPKIQPALVVTDISMPFLSGRDFAGMAKLYNMRAKFIVVSGNADANLADLQAANPNVIGLLRKPFSESDLRSLCEGVLKTAGGS